MQDSPYLAEVKNALSVFNAEKPLKVQLNVCVERIACALVVGGGDLLFPTYDS
jgi:hypothetical protein